MKKILEFVCFGVLALALFSFTGCDSITGGNGKNPEDNTKTEKVNQKNFKARLDSFGLKVDNYAKSRPGVEKHFLHLVLFNAVSVTEYNRENK